MLPSRLTRRLRGTLWLVPLLCILAGVLVSALTVTVDRRVDHTLVPAWLTGSPTDAQTVLSTIATATVTLTTLVLTVTLVAIQLAMGQFSPRIVRALLHDRSSQLAVGLFTATFVHTLLVLREIDDRSGRVPGVSLVVAYLLMFASIVTLVLYVDHAGQSLRPGGLIDLVGNTTRAQLNKEYPQEAAAPPDDIVTASAPGILLSVDRARLVETARRTDSLIELIPMVGDFVCAGAPLLRVHGGRRPPVRQVLRHVVLGSERIHEEDPSYGLRKLVDVAERGIAEPFLDPTTTKQALDRLHDCLRHLAAREFPDGLHRDAQGTLRFIEPVMSWAGYVRLAFDEVRLAGVRSPQVSRRIMAALVDLESVARPERRAPLRRQRMLLESAVHRAYEDQEDAAAALMPDQQGLGSGPDMVQRRPDRPVDDPRKS
ncbi:DUF2254 domain-containing protein [Plantactinospora siamensis]|uniref:DUF2254 domain-containing protein n=1 Tax=Plantactinospora siamensis TaxID=555372 RepID=A0ABV6P5E5_9ACTN